MKTLNECKNEVAQKDGYRDFEAIPHHLFEEYFERAAELYASEFNKPPVYGQTAKKSANQILYDNGINTGELNDEFNCSMLKAMEEYADQFKVKIKVTKGELKVNLDDDELPPSPGSVDVEDKQMIEDIRNILNEDEIYDGTTEKVITRIRESVKEVSREGEPSTQAGEEQLDGLLKSQLRELAERRKKDYDRLADSFERLKQENERLKEYFGNLLASYEQYGEIPSNVMTKAKQALNPKD